MKKKLYKRNTERGGFLFIKDCLWSVHFCFALVVKDRYFLIRLIKLFNLFRKGLMLLICFKCTFDTIKSWMVTA